VHVTLVGGWYSTFDVGCERCGHHAISSASHHRGAVGMQARDARHAIGQPFDVVQ
jgi:hypothetical protein